MLPQSYMAINQYWNDFVTLMGLPHTAETILMWSAKTLDQELDTIKWIGRKRGAVEAHWKCNQPDQGQIQQDVKKLKDEIARMHLNEYTSLTHIASYNSIEARFGFETDENKVWGNIQPPDPTCVSDNWKLLNYSTFEGTESSLRPILAQLLKNVIGSQSQLQSWNNCPLADPDKTPDFSITSAKDISLSWQSLLVPIELENVGLYKEGIGQTIAYMACVMARNPQKSSCLGVYTDGREIVILRLKPQYGIEPFIFVTGRIPLFPEKKPTNPTPGFSALIQLVSATLDDFGALVHPTSAHISTGDLPLSGFIALGCSSKVYASEFAGIPVAVKCREGAHHIGHFVNEMRVLQYLNKVDDGKLFPKLMLGSTTETLVLAPLGKETLRTYVLRRAPTLPDALQMTIKIVKSLKIAHEYSKELWFMHNDLRPSNILITNDNLDPCIIDWGHATTSSDHALNHYGTIAYASDKFLHRTNVEVSPSTDLESVSYILLYVLHATLPWHKAESSNAVITARGRLNAEKYPQVVKLKELAWTDKPHDKIITYLEQELNRF